MEHNLLFVIAGIIVLGIAAQWLSWWFKLPAILALLLLGILAGPVTGFLQPDAMFGDMLFPMVSLGVALVLFEGGLSLRFSDIRGPSQKIGPAVTNLVSWGALLNWGLIAGGVWLVTGLSIEMALLFASLVVVTGPTVINPLLRIVRPVPEVSNMLRWEGILVDPLGALLAVLVYQFISFEMRDNTYLLFFEGLLAGLVTGAVGAMVLAFFMKRHWIPEYLQNPVTLAFVILVFSLGNFFVHESGLLAVTVMGLWLANVRGLDMSDVLDFKESLAILIISVLFIVLGARVDPADILATGWQGVAVLLVVLLARPIVVWLSTLGSAFGWREKALIAWIAPRGIVAAAVSSLFALRLENQGYAEASLLTSFTFLVIIFTVVAQSFTAGPLARLLGLSEEEPRGILIVGANTVARAIGKALKEKGFRVKLTDTTWSEIQAARMDGLETYYGNPVSAHADRHLDLVGIGRLFAMSHRPALNTLACLRYRNEFGQQRVFSLRNASENDESDKMRMVESYHVPRLFGEDVSMQKLASMLSQGAEIKSTLLTEEFDLEAYKAKYNGDHIPLFSIDPKDRLRAFTENYEPPLKPGWTLIALLPQKALNTQPEQKLQEAQT